MVPIILFFAVAAVGVLSLVVMLSVMWQRVGAWRRRRAQLAARAARLAESARLKIEHAGVLAKTEPRHISPVGPRPIAPVEPSPPASVGLTQVLTKLEQSAAFALSPGPALEPASSRSRLAKGSVPMPMAKPTPVVLGSSVLRPAPPPPIASGSVPPPIPGRLPRRR